MPNSWQSITTIPRDQEVLIRSVTGIECLARDQGTAQIKLDKKTNKLTIHCWRRDLGRGKGGDINAVAWKEEEIK